MKTHLRPLLALTSGLFLFGSCTDNEIAGPQTGRQLVTKSATDADVVFHNNK